MIATQLWGHNPVEECGYGPQITGYHTLSITYSYMCYSTTGMEKYQLHWPIVWMVLSPTLSLGSRVAAGPKHSTTVPSNAGPLSVDEKEVALVPNPVPGTAVKAWLPSIGPQEALPIDRCARVQKLLLPFTLQMVVPLPFTVHPKVMVLPGHVERAGKNCPATKQDPGDNILYM